MDNRTPDTKRYEERQARILAAVDLINGLRQGMCPCGYMGTISPKGYCFKCGTQWDIHPRPTPKAPPGSGGTVPEAGPEPAARECWAFYLTLKAAGPRPIYWDTGKTKPDSLAGGEWVRMVEAAPASVSGANRPNLSNPTHKETP
jgi:hypothetical protein